LLLCLGFGAFGLSVGSLKRPMNGSAPRSDAEKKPHDREDASGTQLAIEPTAQEQTENHAEDNL
jgi:hypothetical protein